jgi:hypothetical protein
LRRVRYIFTVRVIRKRRGIAVLEQAQKVKISAWRTLLILLVPPARFERAAPGLGILRSIQLSYGGDGEGTSFTIAGFIAELSLNNKIGFFRIYKIF